MVEAEGCFEAAALGLPSPKSPPFLIDSAARESEVMIPAPSWTGFCQDSGSVVTLGWSVSSHGPFRSCVLDV